MAVLLHQAAGELVPSTTEIFAWCVLRSMRQNPRFRSTLLDDDRTVQLSGSGSVGIAVSLPDDELATVRVGDDEYTDFRGFVRLCRNRIAAAKRGADCEGFHSMTISDLSALGVECASPVIVAPAIASLAIGFRATPEDRKRFSLSLAFDHRLINGAGAARFLVGMQRALEELHRINLTGWTLLSG